MKEACVPNRKKEKRILKNLFAIESGTHRAPKKGRWARNGALSDERVRAGKGRERDLRC